MKRICCFPLKLATTVILSTLFSCELDKEDIAPVQEEDPIQEDPIIEEVVPLPDSIGSWTWLDYGYEAVQGTDIVFASPDTAYLVNRIFHPYPGMRASYDGGKTWLPGEEKYYIFRNYNTIHVAKSNKVILYGKHAPYLGMHNFQANVYNFDFNDINSSTYRSLFFDRWSGYLRDVDSFGENIIALTTLNEVVIVGERGALFDEFDSHSEEYISIGFATDSIGIIGSKDGKLLRTKDRSNSWETILEDPDKYAIIEISFYDANLGFALTNSNVLYRTHDGGESWAKILLPHRSDTEEIYYLNKRVIMVDELRGFTNDRREIFETSDGGLSWYLSLRADASVEAISYNKSDAIWAATSKGLLKLDLE